jgi:hypothetical protein
VGPSQLYASVAVASFQHLVARSQRLQGTGNRFPVHLIVIDDEQRDDRHLR